MARLFIPGPTHVEEDVLEAQAAPMIGHRQAAFVELFARIQAKLREALQTRQRVFVTASSGSGLWEGALRNTVRKRLLLCTCGAFGDRWLKVAQSNGLPMDPLTTPWGQAHRPEQVAETLRKGNYDTLALVHNETSTGVENPVREIVQAARQVRPDLVILVDAVSSAGGVDIKTDEWEIDVLVVSSQKCFALPPGLAFAVVGERAMERARKVPNRGWYFDFLELARYLQRHMTPATPPISLLYALDRQLDRMLAEGMESRFQRHATMAQMTQAWAQERLDLYAEEGFRSRTVTAIRNTRKIDIDDLNRFLNQRGMVVANGYGKLRDITFRIGHMGEIQPRDLGRLFQAIDEYLER